MFRFLKVRYWKNSALVQTSFTHPYTVQDVGFSMGFYGEQRTCSVRL